MCVCLYKYIRKKKLINIRINSKETKGGEGEIVS